MRVALLWLVLAIGTGLLLRMLLALRDSRASAAEYGWAIVPWLIVALSVAPAVHCIFASGCTH